MRYVYFCAHPYVFGRDCQIVSIDKGEDSLRKTALLWKKTNGYANVYVYNMNHEFIWNF
jgi:hypothetical protein